LLFGANTPWKRVRLALGGGDAHNHTGTAFTTWLDLSQAAKQATAIAGAIKRARPLQAGLFDKNLRELEAELLELDRQLINLADEQSSLLLFASHPVYQYLARRYQLNLQSLMWEPEEVPDKAEWQTIENLLTTHPAQLMLWEAGPTAETVNRLKNMGIDTLVFRPMGNRPVKGDFISVMRDNIGRLQKGIEQF